MGLMQEGRGNAPRAGFTIEWRDAFRIGVDEIDDEHRHLFSLVKSLSLLSIHDTLDELLDHVAIHFSHEEQLMDSSGFPEYRQHVDMHASFNAELAEWLASGPEWPQERVEKFRQFLNKWLITHILGHDLRFGRWLWTRARSNPPEPERATPKKPGWFGRLLR